MHRTCLLLVAAIFATSTASTFAADGPLLIKPSEIKWSPCNPELPNGPCQTNYFLGDPKKEPNHSYFRILKGYTFPPHWHSAGSHMVVLKGVFVVGGEGDSKGHAARTGEYSFVPAKWIHWAKCEEEDCLVYYYVDGANSYIDVKEQRP